MQTRGKKPSVRLYSHFLDLRQIQQALYTLVYRIYTKSYSISLPYIMFQHLSGQTKENLEETAIKTADLWIKYEMQG
jgi:hypothetical protein